MAKITHSKTQNAQKTQTGKPGKGLAGSIAPKTGSKASAAPQNAGASETPAPTLASPATRGAARQAANAILADANVNPGKPHKALSGNVNRPAAQPQAAPVAAPPGTVAIPPGFTAVEKDGKNYLRHDQTGMLYLQQTPAAKRGRKAAPVVNASLRVSYLLGKNIGQQKPGVIFEDVPDMWGGDATYTGVIIAAECNVAPGETWAYMYIAGVTGAKGTAERAKAAATFARLAGITSNGSDLNKAPGQAWLTCETTLNEREIKAGHTLPDGSSDDSGEDSDD